MSCQVRQSGIDHVFFYTQRDIRHIACMSSSFQPTNAAASIYLHTLYHIIVYNIYVNNYIDV